jgi:hypothetical protein
MKNKADSRSCAQLSYGDVQNVIDGSKLDAKVDGDHQTSEVEEDIKNLHSLASKLRARRVAAGAVLSKKLKVKFSLDDNKRPIDCEPYETKEANHLVEEVSFASRIFKHELTSSSCYLPTCMYRKSSPMDYPNKLCSGDTKHPSKGDLRDSSSELVNLVSRWIHPPRSHCRNHSIKYKIQMLLYVWNCLSGNLCNSKLIQTRVV